MRDALCIRRFGGILEDGKEAIVFDLCALVFVVLDIV